MDVRRTEPQRSAVLQKKITEENFRLPLAPSEKIPKKNAASAVPKPRTSEVTSRFRSSSPIAKSPSTPATSQRCSSPTVSRRGLSPPPSMPKRSQSAERRRPNTPTHRSSAPLSPSRTSRPSTPVHDVTGEMQLSLRRSSGGRMLDGLWPSMRSLSASFQSECVSVPVSRREKPTSNSNIADDRKLKSLGNAKRDAKRVPSGGKNATDQSENLKPVDNTHSRIPDQRRWPGLTNGKFCARDMSRSLDLSDRVSRSIHLSRSSHGVSPTKRSHFQDASGRDVQRSLGKRGLRRVQGHGFCTTTSFSANPSERAPSSTDSSNTMPLSSSSCASSSVKTSPSATSMGISNQSSLARPPTPSSPSKNVLSSVSSRSMISPSRTRPSTPSSPSNTSLKAASSRSLVSSSRTRLSGHSSSSCVGQTSNVSSLLSHVVDVCKGKKSETQIEAAYQLRTLHNRLLQWRFVNAKADAMMYIQKVATENIMYGLWSTTSKMHDSICTKKISIQQTRQEMKLDLVLNEQMPFLESWVLLEREHSKSLLGAFEALKTSTLVLPVSGEARADSSSLKNAISSAVEVIQAMSSSLHRLLSKVEDVTSVVSELADMAAEERAMVNECRDLLASVAALQVQESSLKTQVLQLRQDNS